jgi:hypothetical protein
MIGCRNIYVFGFVLFCFGAFSQQKYTLSGTISDVSGGENLAGAVLLFQNTAYSAISNSYGFYSITIPEGEYVVSVKYLGYQDQIIHESLHSSQVLNLKLNAVSYQLQHVEVYVDRTNQNISSIDMGSVKVSPRQIESIPVLFGERDLVKTLQLLPGIKAAAEGNSGFYVRGGGIDQNLILLDEAPVYNASHLLGFFSIFNSEAIRDVNMMKGSIPAEYGGRAASVLDIRMKEGNMSDYQTTGSIGLISSNLSFEGPVKKDVSSFMVSARRTYADLFLKIAPDKDLRTTQMYFYDLNMKVNFKLSNNSRLYISGYLGRDKFRLHDQVGYEWGSKTATARLNHTFSEKLFSNSSFIFSNYIYQLDNSGNSDVLLGSRIQDFNLKQDFSWYLNSNNTLKFGANLIDHKIVPGEIKAKPGSLYNSLAVKPRNAIESALYVSDLQNILPRLKLYYGLRLALFTNVGPGDFYRFDSNGNLIQTISYEHFKVVKSQGGLEPRLALNYQLSNRDALKASFNHIYQFIHLLNNSSSTNPNDVWLPSSENVKPQIADQWSLGYFRNSKENKYEGSVETYYKNLQNQIEYKNGADLIFNSTVEAELVFGRGWAYGTEFLFRKNTGKLTGWIGYTWSKTMRQFDQINQGRAFPARQDRRHDFSIVGIYDINPKLKFSAVWVFNTGNAVTFPNGKYEIDGYTVGYYTERNGYRMPDYHRLDLGLTWIRKQTAKYESSWNFSVYNAYGRENAYYISFRQNKINPELTEAVQISLFKVIPSVSYKFKFK